MTDQNDLLRRAAHVLPGGVLGNHRSGAGLEFVVKEGRGAYLWDTNGRRYLDYLLGSGPMLLGHAHPAVVEAVRRQVERGTSYMLLNEPAIELAEELVRAVPCAEQVRYTSSGTEATFFALRVARAFRKRDKVMKFEGGFHGTHDYGMMSVSPRSPRTGRSWRAASRSRGGRRRRRSCVTSTPPSRERRNTSGRPGRSTATRSRAPPGS